MASRVRQDRSYHSEQTVTTPKERARALLDSIYGKELGDEVARDLTPIMEKYREKIPRAHGSSLDQQVAVLITYPDQVQEPGKPTLASLREFCFDHLPGVVSGLHVLPFYPWSSDDGFSVIDYRSVDPRYGSWDDIRQLGQHFSLMFDAVINHVSAQGPWFRAFLDGAPEFREDFIEVTGNPDLSSVVRPRATPLLTEFNGSNGTRRLWTTFSADQVDLNYHNPRVLLQILEVLLFYASMGARFIRLDAIAYLWKEIGTPCINLPQTHWIVQLMRAVLDEAAPEVRLITETNVPNQENLSYFGDGSNEAQLVYNFPLPPLVLHALQTGNASVLSRWAATLKLPSPNVTFLNFLASHDGIGLNPVRGILPESEIEDMVERIRAAGGFVSNKTNPDGTLSPYELNINYFDALDAGDFGMEPDLQVDRFVTAHAILLGFMGVPAIYFHSLFGSRGWPEGVEQSGKYRSINREKLQRSELERQLADPDSLRARVFARLSGLLKIRAAHPCFAPQVPQRVLEGSNTCLLLLREEAETARAVLCAYNPSGQPQHIDVELAGTTLRSARTLYDLISGCDVSGGETVSLDLAPYQSLWLSGGAGR